MTPTTCCDERRRAAIRRLGALPSPPPRPNGIDFLEVVDHDFARYALTEADRQRVLHIWFLRALDASVAFPPASIVIEGGERIRKIGVLSTSIETIDGEKVLRIRVSEPGDFSTYSIRLIDPADPDKKKPHPDLDPPLAEACFRFKVECSSGLDCAQDTACIQPSAENPRLDYLARDFDSFRRLMLDRLSQLLPGPVEQNPADLGVTLVELLAYAGDLWSYRQDAIATEAYLRTARHRISVRRHALLFDYTLLEGHNARLWARVLVAEGAGPFTLPQGTRFYTEVAGEPDRITTPQDEERLLTAGALPFETAHAADIDPLHAEMRFYTWGARQCWLPKGATRATLSGHFPNLKPGEILMLEQVKDPRSGKAAGVDPSRRHAVRLTSVTMTTDELAAVLTVPPTGIAAKVTEITFHEADALPFALCVSAITTDENGAVLAEDVTVARGNMVLVDHGRTVREWLPAVQAPDPRLSPPAPTAACGPPEPREPKPPRYRPRLSQAPVTRAAPSPIAPDRRHLPLPTAVDLRISAAAFLEAKAQDALSVVKIEERTQQVSGFLLAEWKPVADLLSSGPLATDFVCETGDDGSAVLRFGDGEHGKAPKTGALFEAIYRTGNGRTGAIGAGALRHVVTSDARVAGVTNPQPASCAVDPEPIERARRLAPYAFRTQERAVTPADYAEIAGRHPEVQRAAAALRFTGSFYCVFLSIDRRGGRPVDSAFAEEIARFMERYRLAGHDLWVIPPRFVPIDLGLSVCVLPGYLRADVQKALLDALGSRALADGTLGVFHPDNFTFGQPVTLSDIVKKTSAVAGVSAVTVTKLMRLGAPETDARDAGMLPVSALEIARLDNDPSFPENGRLQLDLSGGR